LSDVTGSQVRAARGFLNWSRKDLAERAGISVPTIQAIEGAEGVPEAKKSGAAPTLDYRAAGIASSLAKVTAALEKAGITFLADDGKAGHGVRYRS
jgi:transcriptional regulator with XRE-family HTH domain